MNTLVRTGGAGLVTLGWRQTVMEIKQFVRIREFFDTNYAELRKWALPMVLGKTNGGPAIIRSLAELPHLLIGGTTGSGKSVCLKTIIASLVCGMSPQEMKLILIDPKQVELTPFSDIPHLGAPVVTDSKKAGLVLDWLVKEMDDHRTVSVSRSSTIQIARMEPPSTGIIAPVM